MDNVVLPKITNMVIKFVLDFDIELSFLQFVFTNIDYRPQRFNGAIVKDFGCTLLVFRNGKINVVGVQSIDQAKDAIKEFCKSLSQPNTVKEMVMVNLVASASLDRQINLQKLAENFSHCISYHPELYPAAYYSKSKYDKSKVLIFHTGKLVFTGFKSKEHVNNVFFNLFNLISNK